MAKKTTTKKVSKKAAKKTASKSAKKAAPRSARKTGRKSAKKAATKNAPQAVVKIDLNTTRNRTLTMIRNEVGFDPIQPPNTPASPFPPIFGPQARQGIRPLINGTYFADVNCQVSLAALNAAGTFNAFVAAIWSAIPPWNKN